METRTEEPIQKESAGIIAYNFLLNKIVNGELKPGDRISLRKIAAQVGSSVIPVLEAFQRLSGEMLIQSVPHSGYTVTVPSFAMLKETYQMREAIECLSARLLAQTITEAQYQTLLHYATILDTVPVTDETREEAQKAHRSFHLLLTQYTGNSLMYATLKRINLFWILSNATNQGGKINTCPRYWHRLLLDEIHTGNPERAEMEMRTHILASYQLIEQAHIDGSLP